MIIAVVKPEFSQAAQHQQEQPEQQKRKQQHGLTHPSAHSSMGCHAYTGLPSPSFTNGTEYVKRFLNEK